MYDDNGNKKYLPYCHTDDAHKTLGVILGTDNNNSQQVERMRKLVLKFGDKVIVGYICGHKILHTMNAMVMCPLNYPLPTITITEKECSYMMTSILTTSVPAKIKIVRTIKRNIIYGTVHLQGMGLKKLSTQPGAIQCILRFWPSTANLTGIYDDEARTIK